MNTQQSTVPILREIITSIYRRTFLLAVLAYRLLFIATTIYSVLHLVVPKPYKAHACTAYERADVAMELHC